MHAKTTEQQKIARVMSLAARSHRPHKLRPLVSFMVEKGLLAGGLVAGQLLLVSPAQAAPHGGVVVQGAGTVTQVDSLNTHIDQQSQNLLMDFDSFNLTRDEAVLITQPSSTSLFIGQILGGSPTRIYGSINANGQVVLVNPHGVIFGETATINAAGVFASGLSLDTTGLFKNGRANFKAVSGAGGYVINRGVIAASTGGSVSLLGESVVNQGVIMATLGHVNLASGSKAVVNFGRDQLIGVQVTDPTLENRLGLKSAVSNTGTISAPGGAVMLTASVSRSLFDHAINNQGIVKAQGAEYKNGVIKLFGSGSSVLNTGTLDASSSGDGVAGGRVSITSDSDTRVAGSSHITATSDGGDGGSIEVSGENAVIGAGATLDASGATGGGRITITANATASVGAGARLAADATVKGDGGAVSVSGDTVEVAGDMSVRGGPAGGNGGTVSLSAGSSLSYDGSVDATAPHGRPGTLTLSAPDVTVDNNAAVTARALARSQANIDIDATHSVTVNDLGGSEVDLPGNLGINVTGSAASFTMRGASDVLRTDGTVTVAVTDSEVNGDALIDIAGTIESGPFPSPLPNNPLNPGTTVALTATDGRIRVRATGRLVAGDDDEGDAGTILLTATGDNSGNDAGTIMFSGSADVSSGSGLGGTVKLLADRVALLDEATIDASGTLGGGEVLVGGNAHGQGPERNAQRTYVGSGVNIAADAVDQGPGGKVIVWSDEVTRFYGNITARGGMNGGDGGYVETSGKQQLAFDGTVDTRAPNGNVGELLLDPSTLTIAATGSQDSQLSDGQILAGDGGGAQWSVSASAVVTQLGTTDLLLQATTSITVSTDLSAGTTTHNLSLEAPTVNLEGVITLGSGAVLSGTAFNVNVGAAGSVQNGIDVASSSATTSNRVTIDVASGTYTEDLSITKNFLTLAHTGTGTATIEGVSSDAQTNFPAYQNATDILIDAHDVTLNNLTLETPAVAAGSYAALITLIGDNISITNNTLVSSQGDVAPVGANDSLTNILIQSISASNAPSGSINGLTITGNRFESSVGGKGYYGIYLNQQGAAVGTTSTDQATIDGNSFTGNIWRAISTERSNVQITNNTIDPGSETLAAWGGSGIAVRDFSGTTIDGVTLSGNSVGGSGTFAHDVLLGYTSTDPLTNVSITANTGNIDVNAQVTDSAGVSWDTSGAIAIDAGGNITSGANLSLTATGGTLTLGDGSIAAASGNVTLLGAAILDADANDGTADLTIGGAGTLSMTATSGSIGATGAAIDAAGATKLVLSTQGDLIVTTTGTLTDLTMSVNPATGADTYSISDSGNLAISLSDAGVAVDLSSVSVTSGNVNLSLAASSGDLELGTVSAGTATGSISLTAYAGAITDNVSLVKASTVSLTAANGIGTSLAPVNVDSPSLTVDNNTSGDVYVTDAQSVMLATTFQNGAPNAALSLVAQDGLDTGAVVVSTNGGALTLAVDDPAPASDGNVSLIVGSGGLSGGSIALESADNITLSGPVDAGTGTTTVIAGQSARDNFADSNGAIFGIGLVTGASVNLSAENSIGTSGTRIQTKAGALSLTGNGYGAMYVTESDGASLTASANGDIDVASTAGDLAVGTVNAGTGNVTLTATAGAITGNSANVTGTQVVLSAQTGVGANGAAVGIGSGVTHVDTVVTGTGDIWLSSAGLIDLYNIATTDGSINITGGSMNVLSAMSTGNNGSVNLSTSAGAMSVGGSITAGGAGGVTLDARTTLSVNATVGSISGNLNLGGGGTVSFAAAGDVTTGGSGNIDVASTGADISMQSGTLLKTAATGSVGLTAATSVIVGGIDAGSFAITFDTGGTGGTADLSAATLTFSNSGSIDGGMGSDTLIGRNSGETFVVSGTNQGSFDGGNISFGTTGQIENLQGGTGADTFTVNGGSLGGTVAGGAGNDTLDGTSIATATLSASTSTGYNGTVSGVAGFTGINVLSGASGSTLKGENVASTWTVNGTASMYDDGGTGTLSISGFATLDAGSGGDTFKVTGASTSSLNGGVGNDTFTLNAALTGSIDGGGGNDAIILSAGGTLSGTAAGGTGTDSLTLANVANMVTLSGVGSGVATGTGGFSGIENIIGGTKTDAITIADTGRLTGSTGIDGGGDTDSLTGGANTDAIVITTANGGSLTNTKGTTVFSAITNVNGGSGNDTFTISGASSINLSGGAGSDTFNVHANLTGTISGDTGNDTVAVGNGVTVSGLVSGGTGTDKLDLSASTSATNLTVSGAGTDDGVKSTGAITTGSITLSSGFDDMDQLAASASSGGTLTGSSGGDIFATTGDGAGHLTVGANSVSYDGFTSLAGGAGNDTFSLNAGGKLSGTITGGGGTDTLTATDAAGNTFTVNGSDSGTVKNTAGTTTFSGIANLTGGAGNDTFTLGATGEITGTIDGVNGTDVIDVSGVTAAQTVDVAASTISNVHLYSNIDKVIGDGGNDILSNDNAITVTGVNSGTTGTGLAFSGFSKLQGTTGNDTFTMANGGSIGSIDGLTGTDTIDVSGVTSAQTLDTSAGTISSVGTFANITSVTGDGANDTLVGHVVSVTGSNAGTSDGVAFTGLVSVTGTTGSDSFTLTRSGRLTGSGFAGGGGAGIDTLTADDPAGNSFVVTRLDGGSVQNTAGTTSFSAIANLKGGTGGDGFTLSLGTLSGAIDGGTGTGVNTLTLDNVANTVTVTGANSGSATGITGGFTHINGTLTGGANTDDFILNGGTLTGEIDGGGGINTLMLDNVANTIDVTATNAGTATGVGRFIRVGTITGGTNSDDFVFASGVTLTGGIAGGAGSDSLDLSANTGATNVTLSSSASDGFGGTANTSLSFAGIDTLVGNGSSSTLTGLDATATWTTTATNAGVYVAGAHALSFSQVGNWQGGSGIDTFNVSDDITGQFNGGGGLDTLNVTAAHNAGASFDAAVEVIADSGIDTVTATDIILDGVTSVGQSANPIDINANTLTVTNGSGDVFINAADSIDLLEISTGPGSFMLTVDADNNSASTLTLSGPVSVGGDIDLAGSAALDDNIVVNTDLIAGAGLSISNIANLYVDASTPRSIAASGGNLAIDSNVGGIVLDNGSATVSFSAKATGGGNGNVALSNLSDDGVGGAAANMAISADGNATLAGISLNDTTDGAVAVTADANNDTAGTIVLNGDISDVTSVTLSGGGTGTSDAIQVGGNIGAGGQVKFENADAVTLGSNVDISGSSISATNHIGSVDLAGAGIDIVSATSGAVDLPTITDSATITRLEVHATSAINMADVTLDNSGADNLYLDAGSAGTIAMSGPVSIQGTLSVADSNGAMFQDVSSGSVDIAGTTGGATVQFQGNVDTAALTTAAAGYNLALDGANNTISGSTTFNNTGSLVLGNDAADVTTFVGGVTATAPSGIALAGNVRSSGIAGITLGDADSPVRVTANATVGGSGSGALNIGDATLANSATLTAGTGIDNAISLGAIMGTAGGTTSNLTINTTGFVTVDGDVGTDIGILSVDESGGITFGGSVAASTVTLSDTVGSIAFNGNVAVATLSTGAGGYALAFTGDSTQIRNTLVFNNTGGLTFGDSASDIVQFEGGAIATVSRIDLFGTVSAANNQLNFGAVNVVGSSSIQTGSANLSINTIDSTTSATLSLSGGAMTLAGSVDGVDLAIDNSNGVAFQGPVGTTRPVGITINNTTSGQDISFLGTVHLSDLSTTALGYGISFTGSNTTVDSAVTFNNTGGLTLGNDPSDVLSFVGGLQNTGFSTTSLLGQLSSNAGPITLGNTELGNGATSINSAANGFTSGADIALGSVNGVNATLTVDAGTAGNTVTFSGSAALLALNTVATNYNVAFLGNSSQITNAGLTTFLNTGQVTFGDSQSDSITFDGGISVNGDTAIDGSLGTAGSPMTLHAVTIPAGGTATLVTNGGALTVKGTITGATSAENLVVDTTVGGTMDFQGAIDVNDVTLSGGDITVEKGMTLSGSLTVNNTGTGVFTLDNGAQITATGGFSTTGSVNLAANVQTNDADVNIGGDLTIADAKGVTITTGGGNFQVIGNTQGTAGGAGSESLTVDTAGSGITGNVSFGTITGSGTTGLADVILANAKVSEFGDITMTGGSIVQTNRATGNTNFNGTVALASADLKGTNFSFGAFSTVGALSIDATRSVTQTAASRLSVGGVLSLTANDATLTKLSAIGDVILNVAGYATLNNDQNLALSGSVGGLLDVTANGAISLMSSPTSALVVTGPASFTADSLSLPNLSVGGNVTLNINQDATITSTQAVSLQGSVGNLLTGNLKVTAVSGAITDSGDISVSGIGSFTADGTGGGITLDGTNDSFGSLRLESSAGNVSVNEVDDTKLDAVSANTFTLTSGGSITSGTFSTAGNIVMNAASAIILGGNTTSAGGSVTLTSTEGSIDSSGQIRGATQVNIASAGDVLLSNSDASSPALVSGGGANLISTTGNLNLDGNVNVSGDFKAMSIAGQISQEKNSAITAGGSVVMSAESGMNIATIDAGGDVTLILTQTAPNPDGSPPLFKRVNDQPANGDTNPDIRSENGIISFVAPEADVGTATDPFVSRAESPNGGIFYGLQNGAEYSFDIGNSLQLYTEPDSLSLDISNLVSSDVLALGSSIDPLIFDANFQSNFIDALNSSVNSTGKFGQTAAQASSRETAASGRNEEEEVASVDETAFQNLKNYDENPNGILLPEDQRYAYDDDGNVYFMVTMSSPEGRVEQVPLYKVELKLKYIAPPAAESHEPAKKRARSPNDRTSRRS